MRVKKVVKTGTYEPMCDIKVKDVECFFANGVAVHNSTRAIEQVLVEFGLDTKERTKHGKMKVDKDSLAKIDHPLAQKISQFKSTRTQMKMYVSKFVDETSGRMQYQLFHVPTGRLSSGNANKNSYFLNLNGQNLTKPKGSIYEAVPSSEDGSILGYDFIERDKEFRDLNPDRYYVEGYSQEKNIRKAITVPNDEWLVCSIDYSGQELKIIAMLSKEPAYLNAFKNGEDVHKKTAIAIWGEANYDKDKRNIAKIPNFCLGEYSMVATQKGLVHPSKLNSSHLILSKSGRKQNYSLTTRENEPTYLIEYSSGLKEEYREGHPVYVWTGEDFEWVNVEDLTENMQVVSFVDIPEWTSKSYPVDLSRFQNKKTSNRITFDLNTPFMAYLMGSYLGDGNVKWGKGVPCSVRFVVEEEILKWFVDNLTQIGFSPKIEEKDNIFIVSVNSRGFARWLGDRFGYAHDKHVPYGVYSILSKNNLKWFLSGLIDSDGSAYQGSLFFHNTNKELVHNVALVGAVLGFKTSMTEHKSGITKGGVRVFEDKDGKPLKQTYTLRFYNALDWELPIQYERKRQINRVKNGSHIGWDITDKRLFEGLYNDALKRPDRNKTLISRLDNLRRGRASKLTHDTTKFLHEFDYLPMMRLNYAPVTVRKVTKQTGKIYVIETDTHEYISSCIVSHNSLQYGGTPFTLQKRAGLKKPEAENLFMSFWKGLPTLKSFQKREIKKGYRRGSVYTYYGRPRRVKYFLSSKNKSDRGYGERTILNHPVQGLGGDIIRIVHSRLYEEIFKHKKNLDSVRYIGTVHDEINFYIRKDMYYHWIDKILDIMVVQEPNWELPLTCEVEVGNSLGYMFVFEKDKDNIWRPKRA